MKSRCLAPSFEDRSSLDDRNTLDHRGTLDGGNADGRGNADAGDDIDDLTLVTRAQEGDLRALEILLRRHQAAMYRLAVRILDDRTDAQDAVQEAFLSAWRRLGGYRRDAAFSSWLYRIVTNRCLNMIRARQHRPQASLGGRERPAVGSYGSPEAAADLGGARHALEDALGSLPPEQRVCWVLRENDGLGYDEIAGITGLSADAVRGRIHRARRRLAAAMEEWR